MTKYRIVCPKCKEVGTITVELFHSGYLIAVSEGKTDVQESEDTPEAGLMATCYNCGAEYEPSEYHTLINDGVVEGAYIE